MTSLYLTPDARAVPGPGGGVLVFGLDTPVVLQYRRDGTVERTIGRQGEGPGEFRRVGAVGWLADTIWVRDDGLRRFTYFTPQGTTLRTLSPPQLPPRDPRATLFSARAPLPGGRWLFFEGVLPDAGREIRATGLRTVVLHPGSLATDTVLTARPASRAAIRIASGSGATVAVPQPWAGGDLVSASPDGLRLVRVRRPAAGSETPSALVVTTMRLDGTLLNETMVPFPPRPVTEQLVTRWLEGFEDPTLIRAFGSKGRLVKMLRDSLYRPAFAPPNLIVAFGSDGTTWITRDPDLASPGCDVIDRTGRLVGSLSLPAGARVVAASAEAVWLVREITRGGEAMSVLERRLVLR